MDGVTALDRAAGARTGRALIRLSTARCAPQDRLAAWRKMFGRGVHLRFDVDPIGDAPPSASVELHRWSSASLYFGNTSPVRVRRTPRLVQDGDDDFRLVRAEGAGYRIAARGVDEIVPDGSVAVLFNGAVSEIDYFGPCRVTAIRVRRADLAAALPGLDEHPVRRIAPDVPALALLSSYVGMLRRDGPATDPLVAGRVASHITDLIAHAISTTKEGEPARQCATSAVRLREMKAYIVRNLARPDLSIVAVAAHHRLPLRYVQRLFQAEDITFTDFVLGERLAHARRLLIDPRLRDRPVGIIAHESSFTNHTYFDRAFRGRFGVTPSDLREQASAPPRTGDGDAPSRV